MTTRTGIFIRTIALFGLVTLAWGAPAFAQQQTVLTRFTGSPSSDGVWTRTITDISEPNDPSVAAFHGTYKIRVVYLDVMTAAQLANAYRVAARAALPLPESNPHGYGVVNENSKSPSIRVGKQTGTFNFSDSALVTGSTIVDTFEPFNAEHAPAASPAGLAALAASLAALAWWVRRRRASV